MKFNISSLLAGIVIIIVLAVVLLRGDQLMELVDTIQKGSLLPIVGAIGTQLCKYFCQSFAYSFSFAAVGEDMRPHQTLPLVFGTFFMNTVAPSLNLAGTTLVVDDARRRGIEPGKATSAALLMQITIDGAFVTLMTLSFILLAVTVGLHPLWFGVGCVVVLLVGTMVGIMVLGSLKPALLVSLLRPVERLVNRVLVKIRKNPLKPWVENIVSAFSAAGHTIAANPRPALKAYGLSLCASLCELSCFALVGVSFGVSAPESLLCGYVVATLFAMVSFTPQGVGVVEAMVVVAFTSFGESAAAGTAIGIVYRGIVFWMPFLIGAILIQRTKTFKNDKSEISRDKLPAASRHRLKDASNQDASLAASVHSQLRSKARSSLNAQSDSGLAQGGKVSRQRKDGGPFR